MKNSEYLKKYIQNNDKKIKKKLKGNFKIIDDDISFKKKLNNNVSKNESSEEDPVIADVIDERPEKIIQLESFRLNNKWKAVASPKTKDDNFSLSSSNDNLDTISYSSKINKQEYNSDNDLSPKRKTNKIISDNDLSPARKQNIQKSNEQLPTQDNLLNKKIKKRSDKSLDEDKIKLEAASIIYKKWNSGIKQQEMKNNKIIDIMHEIEKPMARYSDDVDLDNQLRQIEHADDPMLDYIKKRKQKASNRPTLPIYKGPEPPPNRYNIRPGYRWDGVDRSNGFESKYFANLNERKIIKDMAYKWSTEDM